MSEDAVQQQAVLSVRLCKNADLKTLAALELRSDREDVLTLKQFNDLQRCGKSLLLVATLPREEDSERLVGYVAFRTRITDTLVTDLNAFPSDANVRKLDRGCDEWRSTLLLLLSKLNALPLPKFNDYVRNSRVVAARESDLPLQLLLRDCGFRYEKTAKAGSHFREPPEAAYVFRHTTPR